MKDFIKRLSSRKFLLVVAALLAKFFFPELPDESIVLVLGYLGVEGARDVVRAFTDAKLAVAKLNRDISLIEAGEIPVGISGTSRGPIVPGGTAQ